MTRLHVVHLASGREWRGGQRQVHHLVRGMHLVPGTAVSVVTGSGSELARRLLHDGVQVDATAWSIGLDPRVLLHLVRLAGPDVLIHAHDSHAHAIADAAARMTGARVIATRRVDLPVGHPQRWRRAAAAIALSGAIAERLTTTGIDPARIHVVPPGIDTNPPSTSWPAEIVAPPPGRALVTCIAALTPEKGVDVLVDAIPAVRGVRPEAHFLVVGDGAERGALERRAAELGVADAITFAGWIIDPERVLPASAIAVQPSRSEGFGSTVLDALVRGVPVIASRTGGLPDALAAGGGMLVAPDDAAALAAAISGLLADHDARRRLGAAGRAAADTFSISRLVAATLDVYRSA